VVFKANFYFGSEYFTVGRRLNQVFEAHMTVNRRVDCTIGNSQ